MTETQKPSAVVIGSGFGGLAMGIRLQSMGFQTTIYESLDKPGGRAYVRKAKGFTFDMGPTVITVPHFIEELFSLKKNESKLNEPDFPNHVFSQNQQQSPYVITGEVTSNYCTISPISPFYRIYFSDGSYFDYDGDLANTKKQIAKIEAGDLAGYDKFLRDAGAIFRRGFIELGYTSFTDLTSMLKVVPDLLRLDAVRNLFRFTSKYFKSPKLRQVFSFEPLLVGGNPLRVPAIYAMIHFVEKTWGVHYVMGGTGKLVDGFVRKFKELGGVLKLSSPIAEILVDNETEKRNFISRGKSVSGVKLEDGSVVKSLIVVSNADYGHTYLKLIAKRHRFWNSNWRIEHMRWSMSMIVVYFGFKDIPDEPLTLRHHNIILSHRYEGLLKDIFDHKSLSNDFSQYLHIPTITDPSMAPEGFHAAYTLIPVPHNGSGINWAVKGEGFVEKVIRMLDEEGYIPGLCKRITYKSWIDPDYFEKVLRSHLGNFAGPEPVLSQSAWFRPHNRCPDIKGLYLVGAGTQPGGGTPSVMMSAKMTARLIKEDYS